MYTKLPNYINYLVGRITYWNTTVNGALGALRARGGAPAARGQASGCIPRPESAADAPFAAPPCSPPAEYALRLNIVGERATQSCRGRGLPNPLQTRARAVEGR